MFSQCVCSYMHNFIPGNGNKDGLFSVLLRDYKAHAAATCMNRLAKLRYLSSMSFLFLFFIIKFLLVHLGWCLI